jgi:hypothetical protein
MMMLIIEDGSFCGGKDGGVLRGEACNALGPGRRTSTDGRVSQTNTQPGPF